MNYSTPAAAAAALSDLNGVEYPQGSGFRLKVMYAEIMTGSNNSSNSANGGSNTAAALLRSSSSRGSLSAHQGSAPLGAIMRASSGNLSMGHGQGGSSGALAAGGAGGLGGALHAAHVVSAGPAPAMSVVTPIGTAVGPGVSAAGSSAALLSPAGSDPHSSSSTAPATLSGHLNSTGPSPAASPLCDPHSQQMAYHHQQQQQNDIARVTDRLSSLSLPNMSAPSPQHHLGSIGSEHSNDLAVAAAAAQHYSDLKAASGANMAGTGGRADCC